MFKVAFIYFTIFLAVVILGAAVFFSGGREILTPAPVEDDTSSSVQLEDDSLSDKQVIQMTAQGFIPDTLSIKRGETVMWINKDTRAHWPASDVHPVHLIYPEFDPGRQVVPAGEWSFTFLQGGTWSFHDHLYPSERGVINVLE